MSNNNPVSGMEPKRFVSILIFIAAYSPLFLIMCLKDMDAKTWCPRHPVIVLVSILVMTLSVIIALIVLGVKKSGGLTITVTAIRNRSTDLINYTLPYIVSLYGFNLDDPINVITFLLFMVIIGVLTVKTKSVFLNPIFALAGYALHEVDYLHNGKPHTRVVLSKHDLMIDKEYSIKQISKYMYQIYEYKEVGL